MKALIIVDVQNDFCPGGALAVKEGDQAIPVINRIQSQFDLIVATQDWHPKDHKSFASNHGKKIGDIVKIRGLDQILWPDHCIQNSKGAELVDILNKERIMRIFRKGTDPEIDSYSGFFDNGHLKATGLADYLKGKNANEVYVTGLATDYCVKFTALDAIGCGFKTCLVLDACRGVNLKAGDIENAVKLMQSKGVKIINSDDVGL